MSYKRKSVSVRFPREGHISKCLGLLNTFLRVKKVCLKDLQSLTGLLNFTCSVVRPGRAFLRRIYDLAIIGVSKSHHLIRLTKEVKADLRIWQEFLLNFNGRSFFLEDRWYSSQHLHLFTDAAGSLGFGAIFGDRWCYGEWPSNWKGKNIAILEFYPIVLSIYSLGGMYEEPMYIVLH